MGTRFAPTGAGPKATWAGRRAVRASLINTAFPRRIGPVRRGIDASMFVKPFVDLVGSFRPAGLVPPVVSGHAYAPLDLAWVKGFRGIGLRAVCGPAPPASRVLRIAARRPAAALDPGASAGPGQAFAGRPGGLPGGRAQPDPAPSRRCYAAGVTVLVVLFGCRASMVRRTP